MNYTKLTIKDTFIFAIDDIIYDKEGELKDFLRDIAKQYGGFTLTKGYGGWVDDAGKLWLEDCYRLDINTDKGTDYKKIINDIKVRFKQSAVLFERKKLNDISGIY